MASYHDFSHRTEERFYHLFLLGMMVCLQDDFVIRSNREAGRGRYDLLIMPKDKQALAMILELKRVVLPKSQLPASSQCLLKSAALKALEQIDLGGYDHDLRQEGVRQVVHVGLVFAGKHVHAEYSWVDLG